MIQSLLKEKTEYRDLSIPAEPESQRQLLRGLMNIRTPQSVGADFLQTQDAYLQSETAAKGITDIADLTPIQPGLYLWQGDITTLKCDAIVKRCKLRHDRMLYSEPPLHRQRHSHLCGRGAAPCLCGIDGTAGLSRTHWTGKNHSCVQSTLPLCATYGRADHQRTSDQSRQGTAGFLLPLLLETGGREQLGKRGILLHLYGRISFPQ